MSLWQTQSWDTDEGQQTETDNQKKLHCSRFGVFFARLMTMTRRRSGIPFIVPPRLGLRWHACVRDDEQAMKTV